jgi:hypothetical protein
MGSPERVEWKKGGSLMDSFPRRMRILRGDVAIQFRLSRFIAIRSGMIGT